jgi:hypothetical protein
MILCQIDYLFNPGDSQDCMDNDRASGVATKSHSMVGYLSGMAREGRIVKFENVEHLSSTARRNVNTIFYLELGLSVNNYLDNGPNLKLLADTIKDIHNIELVFSHGWDLYSSRVYGWVDPHTTLQCIFDRIAVHKEALEHIPNIRLHFWLGNTEEVEKYQGHFPLADVRYYSIYPMRMIAKQYENQLPFYKAPSTATARTKHFMCLNNYEKAHRTETVRYIIDAEIENKFNLSYLKPNDSELKRTLDGEFEMSNIEQWQDCISHDLVNDSYLYIATETHADDKWKFGRCDGKDYKHDTCIFHKDDIEKYTSMEIPIRGWISEKTLKSAYYELPMMIVGIPGQLASFKSLGFETFPEFFDESYDTISYQGERFNVIKENMMRLCSMDIKEIHNIYYSDVVQDKLEHNKRHFLDMVRNDPYNIVYNYNKQNVEAYIKENPNTTLFEFYENVF